MKKLQHYLGSTQGKFIAGLVIILIALLGYYFYAKTSGKIQSIEGVTVNETDHVRGAQAGTVTLVEFGDFQCPACGAYEPLVRKLTADNSGVLKVVFKHFPLTMIHQNALLAAKASEAAALQGKFWEMHDMLYDKQKEWSAAPNAFDLFVSYAQAIGIDTAKFGTDINNPSIEAKILAELQEGSRLGVQGTPTFFINGKKIENPESPEAFDKLIKDAASSVK